MFPTWHQGVASPTVPAMVGCSPPNSGVVTESCARHRKRKREVTLETSSESPSESEGEVDMDPDSYCQSTPKEMAKAVEEFKEKTLCRCIPKHKMSEITKDYPKPSSQAISLPKLDHDITGTLGKEVPDKSNAQLAKIQASWPHLPRLPTIGPISKSWIFLVQIVSCQQERLLQLSTYLCSDRQCLRSDVVARFRASASLAPSLALL